MIIFKFVNFFYYFHKMKMYLRVQEGVLCLKTIIISVETVTNAIKARKHLNASGIRAKLVKLSPSLSEKGCTHGLEIENNDTYSAVHILKGLGINYKIFNKGEK